MREISRSPRPNRRLCRLPRNPAVVKRLHTPEKSPKLTNVTGTGFVISRSGHVLTNNHVINGCVGNVHGNLAGEATTNLRVVSKGETNDLALLQAPGAFKDAAQDPRNGYSLGQLRYCDWLSFSRPAHLRFYGNNWYSEHTQWRPKRHALSANQRPNRTWKQWRTATGSTGNVVGVVAEKLNAVEFAKLMGDIPQNINFAIKTGAVRDFLDNSVVPYQSAKPGTGQKTAEIAKAARAYTMLISCSVKVEEGAKK